MTRVFPHWPIAAINKRYPIRSQASGVSPIFGVQFANNRTPVLFFFVITHFFRVVQSSSVIGEHSTCTWLGLREDETEQSYKF